ncbi:amidohydrolase family protein [Amycolatopsis orientalis]|uniref:amidohydrolase family protein n=1 Tax=Amycolatopsis orientalis TaxID=31958 RepID=UPI0003A750FD|nr:amidohydrolase family protein [Amycolatopsis orientalis]
MVLPSAAIDGHAHVFRRALRTAANPRYVPDYDATLAEYLTLLDGNAIAGGLLVQPSFLGCDNGFLLNCLSRLRGRLRAVVVLPDEPRDLSPLRVEGVAGVRLNLIGRQVPDLDTSGWRRLGAELDRRGQHLEVQARGEQWTALAPALRRWPSAVVLDHFGLPGVSAEAERIVLGLACHEHVWIKASAPYRSHPSAAAAMLERLLAEAGPHRLLWGSDWPWTRYEHEQTYAACLAWLRGRVGDEVFRAAVAHNPARLLHWSPVPGAARASSASGPVANEGGVLRP